MPHRVRSAYFLGGGQPQAQTLLKSQTLLKYGVTVDLGLLDPFADQGPVESVPSPVVSVARLTERVRRPRTRELRPSYRGVRRRRGCRSVGRPTMLRSPRVRPIV